MKYKVNEETYTKLNELGYNNESRNIFDIAIWLFEEKQVSINTPKVESFYVFNGEYGYKTEIYYRNHQYPSTFGHVSDTPFDALKFGIERFANNPENVINLNNGIVWKNLLVELEN